MIGADFGAVLGVDFACDFVRGFWVGFGVGFATFGFGVLVVFVLLERRFCTIWLGVRGVFFAGFCVFCESVESVEVSFRFDEFILSP